MISKTAPLNPIHFTDSPAIKGREDRYTLLTIDTAKVLQSWRQSLFSFEWLTAEGSLRALDDLPVGLRSQRLLVENALMAGAGVERPVLGVGLLDTVEIGAGRAVFLTLAAHGYKDLMVHIPTANQKDLGLAPKIDF